MSLEGFALCGLFLRSLLPASYQRSRTKKALAFAKAHFVSSGRQYMNDIDNQCVIKLKYPFIPKLGMEHTQIKHLSFEVIL